MEKSPRPGTGKAILLWLILFLICLGLGYPTLNRYDPRATGGLSDSQDYYDLVTRGPEAVASHVRFRVLVPFLARPLYRIAQGHIGSWQPVFFGLLAVNAFFTATTALFLVLVGARLGYGGPVSLLGGALYLLNFETSNARLSGMIDSAEGCFLLAIVWSLLSGRLWLLPVWAVLGAMGKETFAPFSLVLTATWWFVARDCERWKPMDSVAILSTGVSALVTVAAVQSIISGHVIWPWQFAASMHATGWHPESLLANIFDRNLFYGFVWLLPGGILRVRDFPRPWTYACAAAALLDFVMVAWYGAMPGTAARALFSIAGPLLSLSVAACAADTFPGSALSR
jgi:hypothetical protein